MLILRILLGIAFGLLFVGFLLVTVSSPKPADSGTIGMLGLFVFIILILGPLWPNREKHEIFRADNPRFAKGISMYKTSFLLVATFISFRAAHTEWQSPSQADACMTSTVCSVIGSTGIIVVWVLIGLFCLGGAYHAYKKYINA